MLFVLFMIFISLVHSQSGSSCVLYNGSFNNCSKTVFRDNGEECCWCPNGSLCMSKSHAKLDGNCVDPICFPTNETTVSTTTTTTNKPTPIPTKNSSTPTQRPIFPTAPTVRRTICFCEPKHKRRIRRRLQVSPTPRPAWSRNPRRPTITTPVETTCACKVVTGISKPECQQDCVKYAESIDKRDCTWNYFKLTTIEYCNWVAHYASDSDWRYNVKIDKNKAQNSSDLMTNPNKKINLFYILIPFTISSVLVLLLFFYCSCKTNKKVVDDDYNDKLLDTGKLKQPAI